MRYDDQCIIMSIVCGNCQIIYDVDGIIIEVIKDVEVYDWDFKNQ